MLEKHLHSRTSCATAQARLQRVRNAIRSAEHYQAPPGLRTRIRLQLQEAVQEKTVASNWRYWLGSGALALASAIAAVWITVAFFAGPSSEELQIREVIAAHVRSLMLENLTHVASADPHTVKPWFSGKVDFAPPVSNLSAVGYPLLGGRLDYVGQRPVAALAYRRHKHIINLFIWPSLTAGALSQQTVTQQGYHLIGWRAAGLDYWVISDLNRAELAAFVALVDAQ